MTSAPSTSTARCPLRYRFRFDPSHHVLVEARRAAGHDAYAHTMLDAGLRGDPPARAPRHLRTMEADVARGNAVRAALLAERRKARRATSEAYQAYQSHDRTPSPALPPERKMPRRFVPMSDDAWYAVFELLVGQLDNDLWRCLDDGKKHAALFEAEKRRLPGSGIVLGYTAEVYNVSARQLETRSSTTLRYFADADRRVRTLMQLSGVCKTARVVVHAVTHAVVFSGENWRTGLSAKDAPFALKPADLKDRVVTIREMQELDGSLVTTRRHDRIMPKTQGHYYLAILAAFGWKQLGDAQCAAREQQSVRIALARRRAAARDDRRKRIDHFLDVAHDGLSLAKLEAPWCTHPKFANMNPLKACLKGPWLNTSIANLFNYLYAPVITAKFTVGEAIAAFDAFLSRERESVPQTQIDADVADVD